MRKILSLVCILVLVFVICVTMAAPRLVAAAPEMVPTDYGGPTVATIPVDGLGSAYTPSVSNMSSRNLAGVLLSGSINYIQFGSTADSLGAAVFRPMTQGGVSIGQQGLTANSDNVSADFVALYLASAMHDNSPMFSPGLTTTTSHGLLHPDVSVDCAFVAGMFFRESLSHEVIACSGNCITFDGISEVIARSSMSAPLLLSHLRAT